MSVAQTQSDVEVIRKWQVRDLTACAKSGALPRAFEVEDTVERVSNLLVAGKRVLLTGEPGVGRHTVALEVVQRIADGRVPELEHRPVLELSIQRWRSTRVGSENPRVEVMRLVEALAQSDILPYFSDLDVAAGHDVGHLVSLIALHLPGPVLARTVLRRAGAAASDPLLEAHFVRVELEAPDLERTRRILNAWCEHEARGHGSPCAPEAIDATLGLAHRFLPQVPLPGAALDIVRQAARVAGRPGGHADRTEPSRPVGRQEVVDLFCRAHGIPGTLVQPETLLDVAALESALQERLLGQREAVRAVVRAMARIGAGLTEQGRPLAVLLFAGPVGVGKRFLARLLAEHLTGPPGRVVALDMEDFASSSAADALFGNAESGPERASILAARLEGKPWGVLLLERLDRAHPAVLAKLAHWFDNGVFVDPAGHRVSCRALMVVAAVDMGQEVYRGACSDSGGGGRTRSAVRREVACVLARLFSPNLLHRFDQVVLFSALEREHVREIARRAVEAVGARSGFQQRRYRLEVDEVVLDWIAAHGHDPARGVRYLARVVERHVVPEVAEVIARTRASEGSTFRLTVRRNRVVARRVDRKGEPGGRDVVVLPVGGEDGAPSLVRGELLAEAEGVLQSAARRLESLEALKAEASELRARIDREGLWGGEGEAQAIVQRYRELDVAVQSGERLAGPLRHLESARKEVHGSTAPSLEKLAQALGEAARALRRWDERLAEEGAGAVWLVLGKVDPLLPATRWLTDVTRMELAWSKKLGLTARVVACQQADGETSRIVLEVEGQGAGAALAMEQGVHRLVRSQASDLRVFVQVVPRSSASVAPWPRIRPIRRKSGPFQLELTFAARLELPAQRTALDFLGSHQETLSHLLADLRPYLEQDPGAGLEIARVYGVDGAARDPRTGTSIAPLEQVLAGDLRPFLNAWQERESAPED